MFKKIPYSTTEEWLKLRGQGIGGSDAGVIMGFKQFKHYNHEKNIVDLWEEKKTGVSFHKGVTSEAMERGHKLEDLIRRQYAVDHPDKKISVIKDMYVHEKYDFIRASLDGEIVFKNDKNKIGILEIKTTTVHTYNDYKKNWIDGIPDNYLYQVLHYFLVTDYKFAVLVADIRFSYKKEDEFDLNKEIRTYTIYSDHFKKEIQELKEKEIEFWSYVMNDVEPPYRKTYRI